MTSLQSIYHDSARRQFYEETKPTIVIDIPPQSTKMERSREDVVKMVLFKKVEQVLNEYKTPIAAMKCTTGVLTYFPPYAKGMRPDVAWIPYDIENDEDVEDTAKSYNCDRALAYIKKARKTKKTAVLIVYHTMSGSGDEKRTYTPHKFMALV